MLAEGFFYYCFVTPEMKAGTEVSKMNFSGYFYKLGLFLHMFALSAKIYTNLISKRYLKKMLIRT